MFSLTAPGASPAFTLFTASPQLVTGFTFLPLPLFPSRLAPLPSFCPFLVAPKDKPPNQDYCAGLLHQLLGKWNIRQNFKGGKSQSLQVGKRVPSLSPQQRLLGFLPWSFFSQARLTNPQPHPGKPHFYHVRQPEESRKHIKVTFTDCSLGHCKA